MAPSVCSQLGTEAWQVGGPAPRPGVLHCWGWGPLNVGYGGASWHLQISLTSVMGRVTWGARRGHTRSSCS